MINLGGTCLFSEIKQYVVRERLGTPAIVEWRHETVNVEIKNCKMKTPEDDYAKQRDNIA